ncbi:MAG TPA: outer membrane protein assembly factor BamD [Candidatus Cloacimonetes bacterium]|nr:outer membrane protein assembly factor BamD [Candidatus Cloacimonadota bacterium]
MLKKILPLIVLLLVVAGLIFQTLFAQSPTNVPWDQDEDIPEQPRQIILPKGDFDPSQKMQEADKLFIKRKYNKARDIYEIITYMSKGDTLVKRAQFQLANCYYKMRMYEDAIYEYEQLLRMFPYSQYNEEVNYKIGMSWYKLSYPPAYDQTETINALRQFDSFLSQYPNSPLQQEVKNLYGTCINKLLEKKYFNAHIYYMMGYNNAALMYLNEIFDENHHGEIEEKSLKLAAKIYIKTKNWNKLALVADRFVSEYPNNPYIQKINKYLTD